MQRPQQEKSLTSESCFAIYGRTALNSSVSQEERFDAIEKATSSFDHSVQGIHDEEIEAGADVALTKHLVFLEFKTGFRRKPIQSDIVAVTREISLACEALEMVYRASSENVAKSFQRVGTDLLQILVTLIDEEVKTRMQAFSPDVSPEARSADESNAATLDNQPDQDTPGSRCVSPPLEGLYGYGNDDRDILLRKASKILGHFARVGEATRPIAHFPGLLGSILNLINMRPYDSIPWEARLSCLWTIANLACNTDNMQMMMCTPGLINSLVSVGFRPLQPFDPLETTMEVLRSRSIASRALLNLSWPHENKIPMAENMALISVLCQLAVFRDFPLSKSSTIQEVMLQTRRHAVGALRNLAAAPRRSKIALCEFGKGKVLDVLTDAALNDTDQRVKDLSIAAIHNLAIHDTAEMMVERPALVLALKTLLSTDDVDDPCSESPRNHASSTLLVLERSITPEMDSYENLRDLLEAAHPTFPSESDPDEMEPSNQIEV